jgi:hypothetical protein
MRTLRPPLAAIHPFAGRRSRRLAWLPVLLFLAACGSDATAPKLTVADVAGFYQATTFSITQDGSTTDELAAGSTLIITLSDDGSTAGHLFVPGADEGGADFNTSLDGSWTLDGNTVHFTQTEDSFVRDIPFPAEGHTLRADATLPGGPALRITLPKSTDSGA